MPFGFAPVSSNVPLTGLSDMPEGPPVEGNSLVWSDESGTWQFSTPAGEGVGDASCCL
jgi:hypothetical protein